MTKNKLSDLNDHLFMALERLGDEELTAEELEKEIERSKAISTVADKIVANGRLVLDAQKVAATYDTGHKEAHAVNLGFLNG